ncbi:MAG: family 43 glycosylhydrolase, partial [Bacteroidetes bacterium]|nr:family 43 glycosylhydrolase [Bacteroidota bacterium]
MLNREEQCRKSAVKQLSASVGDVNRAGFALVICLLAAWIGFGTAADVDAQTRDSEARHYTNPVIGLPDAVADPFVMKWNGEYYLYTTGNPIMAYHSTDLVTWSKIGPVLYGSDADDDWNQTNIWAPEVVYRNGKFYLNYTATRASSDWRIEEMARRIGIAVSDRPEGPFVDIGDPVTPGWGIDSHIFRDPDSGREYMFYSYLYEPRHPGAGIVADSMTMETRVAGTLSHITRGSEPWEDKSGNPNDGTLRYTNEAPTVLKREDTYYMMYSGGSWDLPTYSLAYARSEQVMTGGLEGTGWEKIMPPILQSTPMVQGPGHNSVTKAPNNVDDITAYHARVVPFTSPGDRETFVDRLYWIDDRIHMKPPSLGRLTAPDQPLFKDLFNRNDGGVGSRWKILSGSWQIVNQQARGSGLLLPDVEPLTYYVFEANVRIPDASTAGAGVSAYFVDEANRVDVLLDPVNRSLRTEIILNGQDIEENVTKLPDDFRFDVYHQLLVTKNAGHLKIAIDGVDLQDHALDLDKGRPGVIAREGMADVDGVALTPHYLDFFDHPEVTWLESGGGWLIDEGALHQVAGSSELFYALKGDAADNYEFVANVKTRDYDSIDATAGVVAAADESGRMLLAGFDHNIWPYGKFFVRLMNNGETEKEISVDLPRGFLYDDYHSIRVVKQGGDFTIYLDEAETVAVGIPFGAATPGLYTEGVRAAFDNVSMKHTIVPSNRILNGRFLAKSWDSGGAAPEM